MDILEMAEGIERMTEGRVDFEKATWMALAFQQLDAGTFKLEDWIFVLDLGTESRSQNSTVSAEASTPITNGNHGARNAT